MENKQGWVLQVELLGIFVALLMMFFSMGSKIDLVAQQTTERTDKMFEMFVTLIKEGNKHNQAITIKQVEFENRLQSQAETVAMVGGKVLEWRDQQLNQRKP